MTSVQQEIDAIKASLRSLNELLAKKDSKCPDGLGEEFECMAAMLKEAESSYKAKASMKKVIVASKKEPQVGKDEDKKLPEAIKTIYNVSNELKKLSQIDPEEPEEKAPEKKPEKPKTQSEKKANPKSKGEKQVNSKSQKGKQVGPKSQGGKQTKKKNPKSKKQAKKVKAK